jgi:hypothetical protein
MTKPSPRIYTYKITFEEVPYYYYGVKKEKYYNQEYWGSPITHKWCWEFYTPKKQILEFFEYSDVGWAEAQEVEKRLIQPVYQTDKWCLNENCGGIISVELARELGKKAGQRIKELGLGICGLSYDERVKYGKIGLDTQRRNKLAIYAFTDEQRIEHGKKANEINKKNGTSIYGLSTEELSEAGKRGGNLTYNMKIGVHGRTKEQMREHGKMGGKLGGKTTSSQIWECTITGHRSNPGGLSSFQKARGIDTSKRKRIE